MRSTEPSGIYFWRLYHIMISVPEAGLHGMSNSGGERLPGVSLMKREAEFLRCESAECGSMTAAFPLNVFQKMKDAVTFAVFGENVPHFLKI